MDILQELKDERDSTYSGINAPLKALRFACVGELLDLATDGAGPGVAWSAAAKRHIS